MRDRHEGDPLLSHRVRRTLLAALAVALSSFASPALAQDLEPRLYSNTPVGMNFLIGGYAYTSGDVLTDPSLPVEDAQVTAHTAYFAYARSFGVLGRSAKVDVVLPWTSADGTATVNSEAVGRKVSGLGDPRLRVSVNLAGAPAMDLEDFLEYRQGTIVGVTFSLFPPLGQYDSDKVLNLGTNRWTFRPEFGVSRAFGRLVTEFSARLSLYTDNSDYFGGHRREQDPVVAVEGHLLYNFPKGIWASFDSTFYGGGRATIDGVPARTQLENVRVGGTLAMPLGRHYSVKVSGSTGAYASSGSDFDLVAVAIQYRWGGGL